MMIENTLPVNFHRMFIEELREWFDTIPTKKQVVEIMLNYEGDNWVIPYVAGKRFAGIELGLSWRELEKKCGR